MGALISIGLGLLRYWKVGLTGAAVLVACLVLMHAKRVYWDAPRAELAQMHASFDKLNGAFAAERAQFDRLREINRQNQLAYGMAQAQRDQARRIADDEKRAAEARARRYEDARAAAAGAGGGDAPVSPAVRAVLDSLWKH